MSKTGILTFHNALSYGAALQAYALQQFMLENGIDNEIIDYRCDFIEENYKKLIKIVKGCELKSFVGSVVQMGNKKASLRLSEEFRKKHMIMSRSVDRQSVTSLRDEYKNFVCGSDQVWSPDCAGFDKTYFLDFARPEQKFSYAASLGCNKLPDDKKADYKRLLSDFGVCSLREQSGADIVSAMGKETRTDIDPTLLLNAKSWDKIAAEPVYDHPYIFLFNVLKPKKMIDYAIKLGKEKGLPVYYLNNKHLPISGLKYAKPVAADGFVSLIKNAEYVVTNSFHGTAFSVVYHKKLIVELETERNRNIRSEELLNMLGIKHREIGDRQAVEPDFEVDWNHADSVLNEHRQSAARYLADSLT